MTDTGDAAPFDQAEAYRRKGWTCTLALPPEAKWPPPAGFTGREGKLPTPADLAKWRTEGYWTKLDDELIHHDASNIAIRLPGSIVALDVDDYGDKHGGDTIVQLAEKWGPLPPTWHSGSREGVSGIYWFQVPAGIDGWPSQAGPDIEVIRNAHRYAVVWPSVHPEGGTYRWWRPDGTLADEGEFPGMGDLPALPEAWLQGLTGTGPDGAARPGSRKAKRQTDAEARAWISELPTGQPCRYVGKLAADLSGMARREDGNAYDNVRDVVLALLRAGETGHPGVRGILLRGRKAYAEAVGDDRGGDTVAEGEFDRFTFGGVGIVLGEPGEKAGTGCDCKPILDLPTVESRSGVSEETPDDGPDGKPVMPTGRPPLDCGNAAIMADWLQANLGAGRLAGMFNRSGEIVHCPRESEDGYVPPPDDRDHDGPAQVRLVESSRIASTIQLTYTCYKYVKQDKDLVAVPAMFPKTAAQVACDVPDMMPNLRVLQGVIHTPIVRADGSILVAPGYDPQTKLLHLPEPGLVVPDVPENPTTENVEAAVAILNYMVGGFPFTSEHTRANYFGLLLTPLLRELAPPPYKLGAITAPQPGSGKTLLATVMRTVHGGVMRGSTPEDDAELRKQVTSILSQTTGPVVTFDNCTGVLNSAIFAALLTSATYSDRLLGATEEVARTNDRLWTLTGNNVKIGGDLPRRTVVVEIDPGEPHPEKRTGFAIADLESWARTNRGTLLHCLLVLIRAWVVAGQEHTPSGSDGYSRWVGIVRAILTNAGIGGEFDHDTTQIDVGEDDDEWADFLGAVHGAAGDESWSVKALLDMFQVPDPVMRGYMLTADRPLTADCLPSDLQSKVAAARGEVSGIGKSLGRYLANREGRWAGELVARDAGRDDHHKVRLWRVEARSDPAGFAGSAGFGSHPRARASEDEVHLNGHNQEQSDSDLSQRNPAKPAYPAANK